MKIAFVIPLVHKGGGTEKVVNCLIEDLKDRHEVTVITNDISDLNMEGVKVIKIPMIRRPVLLKYVTFLICNTFYFLWQKIWSPQQYNIVSSTGADCFFADVITAHFCMAEYLQCIRNRVNKLQKKSLREKFISFTHMIYFHFVKLMEFWIYSRRRISTIIAVSNGVKKDISCHYRRSAKDILVIPNAVDSSRISNTDIKIRTRSSIRKQYNLYNEDFLMLFMGGDWSRKGLALIIESLSLIEFPEVKLLIVGQGDVSSYMELARKLKVENRTIFTGFQKDVAYYYSAADVFVYPSYYEAFSLVTLEAMGSGLPLLASKINGTEELVQDGWNGFFIKHCPKDIAEKIRLLHKNRKLLLEMGNHGLETVSFYSRAQIIARTETVYENVLRTKIQRS